MVCWSLLQEVWLFGSSLHSSVVQSIKVYLCQRLFIYLLHHKVMLLYLLLLPTTRLLNLISAIIIINLGFSHHINLIFISGCWLRILCWIQLHFQSVLVSIRLFSTLFFTTTALLLHQYGWQLRHLILFILKVVSPLSLYLLFTLYLITLLKELVQGRILKLSLVLN